MTTNTNPEAIVQGQLDAYNARDLDLFMTYWADDALYFEYPDNLLADGASAIRERHVARFQETNLFGRILNRVVIGNKVIDHEHVTRTFADGTGYIEVIAIYEVVSEKIASVRLIISPPVLDK